MTPHRFLSISMLLCLCAAAPAFAHCSLDSPNGGETFVAGEVVTIQWHIYIAHDLQNWDLWYATDAGDPFSQCGDQSQYTWVPIVMDLTPNCTNAGGGCGVPGGCTMSYAWTVPDGINSNQVKIRVRMDNSATDYYDVSDTPFTVISSASVPQAIAGRGLMLWPGVPNPMRRETTISYALWDASQDARLVVRDALGRNVRTLPAATSGGVHFLRWDGTDATGRRLPAGTYFYTLAAGGREMTRKLVLID